MNFRNISAWSIRNPIIPIVLFIGLTLAGLLSFMRLPVVNFPDVEFPMVSVLISQPGAAPTEIETQITQRVESAVRSINGVETINSTASEGSSSTMVEFAIGTDVNVAVNEVTNAIAQIRGDLPDGILEPRVAKVQNAGGGIIGFYAVSAPDMTPEQLSWFVDDTVSKRLLAVSGMAAVSRAGGVDREIRVVLDPARMQALGVTARDVNAALRQININAAGGQTEIAGSRQSVRVLGNADDAYALSQLRIPAARGATIKLSDIADVSDGYSEPRRLSKVDGAQVVTFSFERARGVSEVDVYDGAVAAMRAIEAENPGVTFTELFTPVPYTKQQYATSMAALIEGAVLAIVVVFFFLRDWRATFISAVAIPLSAIPTFWFMDLLGFNLNFLSLLALSLVAGVLVDDAIVEIENIVRHMRMGKSAYQASIDAADEIGLAVVATSFSIVAVFLPVGLMPGIPGEFFKPFGLTVVVAVLMSLLVARMITPMMAAYFLEAKGHAEHGEGRAMDLYMRVLGWTLRSDESRAMLARIERVPGTWLYRSIALLAVFAMVGAFVFGVTMAFQLLVGSGLLPILIVALIAPFVGLALAVVVAIVLRFLLGLFGGFGRYYRSFSARLYARTRDHRFYAFMAGVFALIMTGALFAGLPQQFQPNTNEDGSRVTIELVPGTTIEQTQAVASQVEAVLREAPEVALVTQAIREGSATLYVDLVPAEEREATSVEFERRLNPALAAIPDARVSFASQSGGGFGSGRDISVMLAGSDPILLEQTAQTLVEQMRGLPGVVAPRIAADLRRPELIITPREDLAAQLGVTTAALSNAIRIATLGEIDQNAARFSLTDRQVPIRVILPRESRRDIATIQNLPVPTASGASVPLRRVADISFGSGPTQIQRYNQSRRVFVGADLAEGQVKGPVMESIQRLPIMRDLPPGVSNEAVGEDKWQAEMIASFAVAVVSGVLLVFGVLVLLYHRFVSPLVNMTSLLLAPLGGLIALLIVDQPISMPVYIGMLMLLGIVAKNSILLIDFAMEEMNKGVPKLQAIMDAGHKRAQPIVMTTVAMTAGMVPTAISVSGDAAWRAPMGTVVIGGLLLSTVLTLVLIPAGFSLADGFEKRVGPWLSRRLLTYRPGDEQRPTGPQTSGSSLPTPAE
ncbi:efflux RND transporter permease subunit [Erythrobacteraceae bacterium CFH 75059]|uniref:efflux RND transporter permease subunit n=1 Tax=Qipengyuania thermophila TaxID=2509361 RepID=UPI001020CDBB|nr:efflux RND transporter permease subunit [Qipengyuania thermophila]TCD06741.1 efflux RND transporter permease subunit [Erythrobacteraceae bacterium CFH 75059]